MSDLEPGVRDRLIDAGVELVTIGGTGAVSLREIARRAGVSHGAPRRYFPTHLDLLSAIARRGFTDLARLIDRAAAEDASPRDRVLAAGRAYLEFAADHRGMYELMFRHDLLESDGRLGLREVTLPLFHSVTEMVADALGSSRTDPEVAAGALWSNVHGIAQLWEWGSLPVATGLSTPEPLLRAAIDAHLGQAGPS